MLARRDRHRNFILANQVVGHADVVEVVHLDHYMVEPAVASGNSECDRVIAVVAMHEDQPGALALADCVLDAAAHSELHVEAPGRLDVALADDAVAQAAAARLEASMHAAAWMERLAELSERAMINLDWISVGVAQLHHFEHSALVGLVVRAYAELDSTFGQLTLHLRELVGTGNAQSQVCEVVAAVGMQHDPMMQIVHPQVASIRLALVGHLEADDVAREIFPRGEVLHPDSHVA